MRFQISLTASHAMPAPAFLAVWNVPCKANARSAMEGFSSKKVNARAVVTIVSNVTTHSVSVARLPSSKLQARTVSPVLTNAKLVWTAEDSTNAQAAKSEPTFPPKQNPAWLAMLTVWIVPVPASAPSAQPPDSTSWKESAWPAKPIA